MNTVPLLVLATADDTGGFAADLANRSNTAHRPAELMTPPTAMDALMTNGMADGEPITKGTGWMAAVPFDGIRAPSLSEIQT